METNRLHREVQSFPAALEKLPPGKKAQRRAINRRIKLFILLSVLFWLMSGCCSYEKCQDKYGTRVDSATVFRVDTFEVHHKDTVYVPGDSMSFDIGFIETEVEVDTDTVVIREGRAQAKFWKNKYSRLKGSFECLPDTITKTDTLKIVRRDSIRVPIKQKFEPDNSLKWWQEALGWLFIGLIIIVTVREIIRKIL